MPDLSLNSLERSATALRKNSAQLPPNCESMNSTSALA